MRYTNVKQHVATDYAVACLSMMCLHYKKGNINYAIKGYDGY